MTDGLMPLIGARCVRASEPGDAERETEDRIKALTAERAGQPPGQFLNIRPDLPQVRISGRHSADSQDPAP